MIMDRLLRSSTRHGAVVLADAHVLAVVVLYLPHRFRRILQAIVRDRLGDGAVATDRNVTGRTCYAAARRAQDQAQR